MAHDAFISYSTRDKAVADATCAAVEASGICCWMAPRDIAPGAEWGEAIIEGINQCRVMILIFSENANNSPQIRREVERAVSKGIPIIPLRIQDIAPAHSLEYFIGTVQWLDAVTPPLELHLRRLVESLKALLRVPPAVVTLGAPANSVAPARGALSPAAGPRWQRSPIPAAMAALAVVVLGGGIWWFTHTKATPPPVAPIADRPEVRMPAHPVVSAVVDPAVIGTFEHSTVIDGYDWHFMYTITAGGRYHLASTQEEQGTFQAGNGMYRTVAAKTGRVRTGTYWAAGGSAIDVKSDAGTATYRPTDPTTVVNPANPVMLGTWKATVVQAGLTWSLTLQNNPDGTYRYQARAEDSGTCTYANQQWRATSATTGQSDLGTYRVVDAKDIEFTGQTGSAVWRRQ